MTDIFEKLKYLQEYEQRYGLNSTRIVFDYEYHEGGVQKNKTFFTNEQCFVDNDGVWYWKLFEQEPKFPVNADRMLDLIEEEAHSDRWDSDVYLSRISQCIKGPICFCIMNSSDDDNDFDWQDEIKKKLYATKIYGIYGYDKIVHINLTNMEG